MATWLRTRTPLVKDDLSRGSLVSAYVTTLAEDHPAIWAATICEAIIEPGGSNSAKPPFSDTSAILDLWRARSVFLKCAKFLASVHFLSCAISTLPGHEARSTRI